MQTSTLPPPTQSKPDTTLRCVYRDDIRHEVLLLEWWKVITLDNEIQQTLCNSLHAPLAFCAHFAQPDILRFCVDDQGIWFAFWVVPLFAGGVQGLWIRQGYRKSRISADCFMRALTWGFSRYPVLLTTTTQPHVVRQLVRLGYSPPHHLPYFWNGVEGVSVQHQTRKHWQEREVCTDSSYRGSAIYGKCTERH